MKTFTIDDIRGWEPCYDPAKYLPEGWCGTALDLLLIDVIPIRDRFWVVLRCEVIDGKTLRLFAVWCARQVSHKLSDPRSLMAIIVAEKFANGEATEEELAAARAAAWAARAAAGAAAWDARAAAGATAWAARAAARAAAGDARAAAGAAAWDASEKSQLDHLIKMLEKLKGER